MGISGGKPLTGNRACPLYTYFENGDSQFFVKLAHLLSSLFLYFGEQLFRADLHKLKHFRTLRMLYQIVTLSSSPILATEKPILIGG